MDEKKWRKVFKDYSLLIIYSFIDLLLLISWERQMKTLIGCRRTGKSREKIACRWLPRNYITYRCRVSGTLACWGLSGYSFYLLKTKRPLSVADKRFYIILGAASALLGVYRGFFYFLGVFYKQAKNTDMGECNTRWLHSLPSHRVFRELHRYFPTHSPESKYRDRTRSTVF